MNIRFKTITMVLLLALSPGLALADDAVMQELGSLKLQDRRCRI